MSLLGMAPQIMSAAGSIWQALSGGGRPQRGRQRAPRKRWSTKKKIGVGAAIGALGVAGYAAYRYQAGQSVGVGPSYTGSPSFSVPMATAAPAVGGGQPSGGYTPTQQE